jgi:hypothetical protein
MPRNSGESATLRRVSLAPLIPITKAFSIEFDILRKIRFEDFIIFRIVIHEGLKKAGGTYVIKQGLEGIVTYAKRGERFVV